MKLVVKHEFMKSEGKIPIANENEKCTYPSGN